MQYSQWSEGAAWSLWSGVLCSHQLWQLPPAFSIWGWNQWEVVVGHNGHTLPCSLVTPSLVIHSLHPPWSHPPYTLPSHTLPPLSIITPSLHPPWSHPPYTLPGHTLPAVVRLWSLQLFTTLVVFKAHIYPVWSVDFSPLGFYFASGSHDRTACVWNTEQAHPVRVLAGHTADVDVSQSYILSVPQ